MSEFDTTWKTLQTLDSLLGSYVTIGPDRKLTLFQRVYQWMWMLGLTSITALIISTIIMNHSDISFFLQCAIMFQMYVTCGLMNIVLWIHKNRVKKVLHWCKEMQAMENDHMNQARILVRKTVKRLVLYFGFSFFSISIGLIIIGQILPEEMYPTFRPPLPYELPVEDRDNWTIYIITCGMQTFGVFYAQIFPCFYYSTFSTFGIIFYAYLNTLLDDIKEVNEMSKTWTSKSIDGSNRNYLDFKLKMNGIAEKYCEGLE